jgi:hypothetical protein
MKLNLVNVIIAMGFLAVMSSCSKEEQAEVKPVRVSQNTSDPDPDGDGLTFLPEGEVYFIEDSVLIFGQVSTRYQLFKPLSLDKYKNGELLDSICNQDISVRFETKGRKSQDKSVKWGDKPWVADEFPPVITFRIGNTLTMKFSKMVTGFGFEYNSPYEGIRWSITPTYRNSQLNKTKPPVLTRFLGGLTTNRPPLGMPGGAVLTARESQMPFDQVTITFGAPLGQTTPGTGPYDITLASFRYKLAD